MASKPVTIRYIGPGSQPDLKIMYSIELWTALLSLAFVPSGITKLVLILLSFFPIIEDNQPFDCTTFV